MEENINLNELDDELMLDNNSLSHIPRENKNTDYCNEFQDTHNLKKKKTKTIDNNKLPLEFRYILKYCEKNDLDRVKECIRRYPYSIRARDSDGYTPLHRACHNDNVELVKFLIDNGADYEDKTNEDWRPLHCAAYWGNFNVVNFLVRFGVNISALTKGNNTCLHFAVHSNNRSLLECLVYNPLMDLKAKNGSGDCAYDICRRKNENYQIFDNLLNEDAY